MTNQHSFNNDRLSALRAFLADSSTTTGDLLQAKGRVTELLDSIERIDPNLKDICSKTLVWIDDEIIARAVLPRYQMAVVIES
jgi:hypothetical protein